MPLILGIYLLIKILKFLHESTFLAGLKDIHSIQLIVADDINGKLESLEKQPAFCHHYGVATPPNTQNRLF